MKLSPLLNRVKETLTYYPETREHESKLVFAVWGRELRESEGLLISCMTLQEIDKRIETGRFSSYESICRFARLIKQSHPELKGKRKRKDEVEVIKEIKVLEYKENLFEL